jgi:hypothetical protein
MRSKKIAVLSSSAVLLISGWLPLCATITVAGGSALIAGCSADRSDSRQDARTEARTSERTEKRVEERHD